jgi:multisubunit Na+/H+ antiporter MnhF subunit
MNSWEVAAVVLAAALVPCLAVCVFATAGDALVALEVASVLCITVLMLLAEGFHRQPFIDLAIVLALVSLVGSLAFARMMERHL